MTSVLFRNVQVWHAEADRPYPGEVLVQGNRIQAVAKGRNRIAEEAAAETIDGEGRTVMPGLVEGHCRLSFVGISQNKRRR